MLTVGDMHDAHTLLLVCTRGLDEILGFRLNKIGERRLRGRKVEAKSEAAMEAESYLVSKVNPFTTEILPNSNYKKERGEVLIIYKLGL